MYCKAKNKFGVIRKFLKIFILENYMTDFLGFLFRMILNLYGITFHPAVVLGPEHDFLFKSALTYCEKAA